MNEYVYIENNPHDRVRRFTPKSFNEAIDQKANLTLRSTVAVGPLAIRDRLEELDTEWDVDRILMLLFGSTVMLQLWQAYGKDNKRWLWGPLFQTPFLLLQAMVGWCPPMYFLRKMGLRTRFEIEAEKNALLKVLYERDWDERQKDILIEDWSNDVF